MARRGPTLARLHIWLGWLIGVPLLLWTATGLFMVSQPIERVRGEHLKAPPAPLTYRGPVRLPATAGRAVRSITLEQRVDGPRWVIAFADGGGRLADPVTGALLPPIDAASAAALARAAFAGTAALKGVERFAADAAPIDLRRERPSWCASFADGTRIYIDADTGAVLAVRTTLWRWYDFMWGLHIMDLQTREETSHPLLIGFAALALAGTLIGVVLLFRRRRFR